MTDDTTATTETEVTTPTPPEAPTVEQLQEQLATLQAKNEKLLKDVNKHRTRAEEVEAARRAAEERSLSEKSLEEQLAAAKQAAEEATQAATAAEEKRINAERRAALTGHVADPAAALKLLDEQHLDDDGNVLVDRLLETYPFLAPTQPGRPAAQSGAGTAPKAPSPLDRVDELLKSPRQTDKARAAALLAESMNRR
jgi:hypothetical protein